MLSRMVIAFLTRSKHLLISWLQSPSSVILEPKKRKSLTVSTFPPSICHEVMGPDAMILVFLGSKIIADSDCNHEIRRRLLLGRKAMTNQDCIKEQKHYFANKGSHNQSYGFSGSHIWMWELDYKESWVPKNWCFWTVVLEKALESPLDCRKIKPVNPKGIQSWIHWKDWCWSWISNTLVTWCEELTHLKRSWCWERLRAGGEADDRV